MFLLTHPKSLEIERSERLWRGVEENVAIFGSSRAAMCIVSDLLATNAYNYGIRGSEMNETVFMIKKRLQSMTNGIVVINLDLHGVPDDWGDVHKHPFRGEYRFVAQRSEMPIGVLKCTDTLPGLRFQGKLKSTLTDWLQRRNNTKSEIVCGAQLFKESPNESAWGYMQKVANLSDFHMANDFQSVLDEIYETRHPNVSIVWVVCPISPALCGKYNNAPINEFLEYQMMNEGVYAFNFIGESKFFGRECFCDWYHLNLKGAREFTALLRQKMVTIQELNKGLVDN